MRGGDVMSFDVMWLSDMNVVVALNSCTGNIL